jgi:hypothetical protein
MNKEDFKMWLMGHIYTNTKISPDILFPVIDKMVEQEIDKANTFKDFQVKRNDFINPIIEKTMKNDLEFLEKNLTPYASKAAEFLNGR